MKIFPVYALCSAALFTLLPGCGNSSRQLSVVNAQQAYSTSTVNGTYAFTYFGYNLDNSGTASAASGTVQFDGNGNIATGALTAQVGAGQTCQYTAKGAYSVQSSGSGSASMMLTSSDPSCAASPFPINLTVAQQGAAFVFVAAAGSTGPGGQLSGAAFKQ